MAILNFSDVLKNVGLDPKRVKLIRHSLGDKAFKKCYDKGMVEEYTRVQSETFSNGYDYWCVFISDKSTTAKFFACYKVSGGVIDTQDTKPKGFPLEDWFQGQRMFYNLERIDLLKEYEGRLLIEWGKSALAWAQKGTNEKPIVAIRDKKIFSGYENAILTYEELREIVQDPTAYETWHTALSTVNAVYLIVDRENGRKYVGSAYGKGGLLGRWTHYVKSLHGDNKLMKELLCDYPDRYTHFQFSILQLLPKAVTPDEVIQTETLWKKKLGSISSISGFKPSSLRAMLRRLVVKSFIFRTSSKLDAIFSLDSIMVASGFLKSVSRRFCRTAKGVRNSWEAFSTKAFCFCILSRRGLTLRRAKKRLANKEIPQKQIMMRAI